MNKNEIVSAILSQFPGATIVRKGKQNFIAVPGEVVDNVQTYYSVAVGSLLHKDTKTNTAFDFTSAAADYEAYAASVAEKAAKPKAPRKSGADPEKQAAQAARKEAILAWLIENPGEHTATEVKAGVECLADITIMQVGSDLKSLFADGSIVCEKKESKNYWSFVG